MEDDPFDPFVGFGCAPEWGRDEQEFLFSGEGAAVSGLNEVGAKRFDLSEAIRVGAFAMGKAIEIFDDVIGDLDCGLGGGFVPGFGDGDPAFVAYAAVIGGEGCGEDEGRGTG